MVAKAIENKILKDANTIFKGSRLKKQVQQLRNFAKVKGTMSTTKQIQWLKKIEEQQLNANLEHLERQQDHWALDIEQRKKQNQTDLNTEKDKEDLNLKDQ